MSIFHKGNGKKKWKGRARMISLAETKVSFKGAVGDEAKMPVTRVARKNVRNSIACDAEKISKKYPSAIIGTDKGITGIAQEISYKDVKVVCRKMLTDISTCPTCKRTYSKNTIVFMIRGRFVCPTCGTKLKRK